MKKIQTLVVVLASLFSLNSFAKTDLSYTCTAKAGLLSKPILILSDVPSKHTDADTATEYGYYLSVDGGKTFRTAIYSDGQDFTADKTGEMGGGDYIASPSAGTFSQDRELIINWKLSCNPMSADDIAKYRAQLVQ